MKEYEARPLQPTTEGARPAPRPLRKGGGEQRAGRPSERPSRSADAADPRQASARVHQGPTTQYGDAGLDMLAATFGVIEEPPRTLNEAERQEYEAYVAFMQA